MDAPKNRTSRSSSLPPTNPLVESISLSLMQLNPDSARANFSHNQQNNDKSTIFIVVTQGCMTFEVDFIQQPSNTGEAFILRQSQVFRFESASSDMQAYALRVPSAMLSHEVLSSLPNLLLHNSSFAMDYDRYKETVTILDTLAGHITEATSSLTDTGDQRLALSVAGIITEQLTAFVGSQYTPRQISRLPLLTRLHSHFNSHLIQSRLPSHFASLLGVTTNHLNSCIKQALGINASLHLRRESIKLICRRLAMTDESIREISISLGYDDPAYFTRVFTKEFGMTPTKFRSIYRPLL